MASDLKDESKKDEPRGLPSLLTGPPPAVVKKATSVSGEPSPALSATTKARTSISELDVNDSEEPTQPRVHPDEVQERAEPTTPSYRLERIAPERPANVKRPTVRLSLACYRLLHNLTERLHTYLKKNGAL
ncbi:MAG: hypothetical protein AAFP04_01020 [Myxococcota bacterium]